MEDNIMSGTHHLKGPFFFHQVHIGKNIAIMKYFFTECTSHMFAVRECLCWNDASNSGKSLYITCLPLRNEGEINEVIILLVIEHHWSSLLQC